MDAALNAIMIYAKDMRRTADFYEKFFGFSTSGEIVEGLIELTSAASSARILIHQSAKGVRLGQASVKLVFSIEDVEDFKVISAEKGLAFGSTHQANGYSFANTKDPDQNTVSISSREFRKKV